MISHLHAPYFGSFPLLICRSYSDHSNAFMGGGYENVNIYHVRFFFFSNWTLHVFLVHLKVRCNLTYIWTIRSTNSIIIMGTKKWGRMVDILATRTAFQFFFVVFKIFIVNFNFYYFFFFYVYLIALWDRIPISVALYILMSIIIIFW